MLSKGIGDDAILRLRGWSFLYFDFGRNVRDSTERIEYEEIY